MEADQRKNLFQATAAQRQCHRCEAMPTFVRQMLDPCTEKTVRMFECKCGTYSYSE